MKWGSGGTNPYDFLMKEKVSKLITLHLNIGWQSI